MCQEVLPNCVSTARCNTPTLLQTLDKGAPLPSEQAKCYLLGHPVRACPFIPSLSAVSAFHGSYAS